MHPSRESVFIVDTGRTAIGRLYKSLANVSAAQLAAAVMRAFIERNATIKKKGIDQVILGNVVSAATGQNLACEAALLSGLSESVPAFSVNQVCGAGLQAVMIACQAMKAAESQVVIAAGTESASRSPKIFLELKHKYRVESLIYDGLWCHLTDKHMGELAELTAEKFAINRETQDRYALASHQKTYAALLDKNFDREIVPIRVEADGIFKQDERIRPDTTFEQLRGLPAAFKENGTITAGNSSAPSDGAAAVLLAASSGVRKYKLTPRARILGYASVAVNPLEVFASTRLSIKQCLEQCGLSLKDIDFFEISEAFAVQAVLTRSSLKIPSAKMNVWGGDIALGHPLGAAGLRALVTLVHVLEKQKKKRGVASVCFGGGGSIAMAIEKI